MNAAKLIHLLYQTTRAISQGVNQILAEYGLYSSEWSIIVTIKETGPISQIALASYLNIEPAAISKTVVKLEEKGFVKRKSGIDKREKKVSLTEKALSQYAVWEKAINSHRQSILADLSDEKQHELYVMLESIYANSQKYRK
ncbi:MarR family winged helix-turn-helix transcriptional regulator [Sporomusa acidovorans]|uniref:HTH-type transcriptional regulator n=1 Tax=Sporomusa acidovorans (strain ATCC 49682 / DSM 3132 / Mol) TaxID=1123286 RepID=A0ABZ3IZM0_SPOA4|nr:MarR family transcriptional regulator [Sporomusa acidovorans]OZC18325.1 putative HTH-type transcriptional regulator [Sporomusa acidovorans DSM 3132]SDF19942.1 DNA-binding transcriptional regulator, MarR family [Sporomusa acidovorans]